MLAAQKGISMREYVLESLSKSVESEAESINLRQNKFKKILAANELITVERSWRLILPANVPFVSNPINSVFYHIPLLRRLGMLEYIIIKKK